MISPSTPDLRLSTGLRYMVGAAFFFSLMSLFVKLIGQHLPSQQIVLVRSAVTLLYSYVAVRWAGLALWGHDRKLLLLRGVLGLAGVSCFFLALTKLPLADATVIHYTNPVLTALIASFVLGESLSRAEVGGAALSLGGVALVARPSFLFGGGGLDPVYVGVALLGALCAASAYAVVRKLRATEHPLVIVFYFPLVATAGSVPLAAPTAVWPTAWEWLLLIVGVAGTAQIAQVLLTHGLHAERAGRALSMSYLQIVFAAIWGMLFFAEYPDVLSVVGAVLVIGGTLVVAMAEQHDEPEQAERHDEDVPVAS